jgi:hypothetical protein
MKKIFVLLGLMFITVSAMAYVTIAFPGWDKLEVWSPDIVIVHCVNSPDLFDTWENGHQVDWDLIEADVKIVSVLKGATNSGPMRMMSEYWPKKGEYYLLFAIYHDGIYQATEDYRVLPLGAPFTARHLAGKPLKEQIQMLFGYADHVLDEEIKEDQERKARLKQGLKK